MRLRPVPAFVALVCAALAAAGCDELFPNRTPGERLWRKHCAECHGIDGAGNTVRSMGNPWADLRDDSWRQGSDPASIENSIRQGIFGKMPGNEDLSREEVRQLVDYLYRLRGETTE